MSARQAFIPQPPSRAPSTEPLQTDARAKDGDRDAHINGNGRPRSIVAFLGQKRGTEADIASQGLGPTKGPGLGRPNSSANRRSFEGILRPEMTPMSIIPYPTTGAKQPGAGQTPRKTVGTGMFEFPRPMTPVSVPRSLKKGPGTFTDVQENDATSNGNMRGSGTTFSGSGGEANMRMGLGTGVGGYMRMFEEVEGGPGAGGVQSSLERDIAAPMPGYALGGLGTNLGEERCEVDGMFARSSRSMDAMSETEVGMERNSNSQRSFGGMKRGIYHEDMDGNGKYTEHHQHQGSAKRMKQLQQCPDEYFPISSPHIPPTPRPPTLSTDVLDPSLIAGSLFDNLEELVSLEEIEVDWKRWRECTTEEWLKGADEIAQDYTDIINMVKDHLTEKVLAYASMISSVEEKRTDVNRNIELIHGKGNVVRENISKLGTKK